MAGTYESQTVRTNLEELSRMTNLETFLRIALECGISHRRYPVAKDFFDNHPTSTCINELYHQGCSVLVNYVNDGTIAVVKNWGIKGRQVGWIGPETRDPFDQRLVESIKETLIKYRSKN